MFVASRITGDILEINFGAVRMVGGIITADIFVEGDVNIKYNHMLIQEFNNKLHFILSLLLFVLIYVFCIHRVQVVQFHK